MEIDLNWPAPDFEPANAKLWRHGISFDARRKRKLGEFIVRLMKEKLHGQEESSSEKSSDD